MPRTNALAKGLWGSGPAMAALVGDRPSTPMRWSLRPRCASTAIGAASTAPRPVTKARRFIDLSILHNPKGWSKQFGQLLMLYVERLLASSTAQRGPTPTRPCDLSAA